MARTPMPWGRLAAEFVVIVAGVLVALAADDYRDRVNDRRLERESLRQVLRDLEIDREDISPMLEQTTISTSNWSRPGLTETRAVASASRDART